MDVNDSSLKVVVNIVVVGFLAEEFVVVEDLDAVVPELGVAVPIETVWRSTSSPPPHPHPHQFPIFFL